MNLIQVWVYLSLSLSLFGKKLVIFPLFNLCLMILELWNIHGSIEMTSLNNIFFKKYLWCKIQLHAKCRSRFKKDSYPTPNCLGLIESQGRWNIKFLYFQKAKHWACMVLSIASIIILFILHYSSPMQNEHEHFNSLSKYCQW